ncbi:unnamed protein product [Schistosoma curassoni]|uniref:Uncharacterized protein n=1 Tax=Schistosoma curassoni TaxID=6186 RepID=A0A183K280_9TREM|nr:unnamed protein product [Schistosoma curassoni]VDP34107.1 unnamed protein product [Schistosoma curassoni]
MDLIRSSLLIVSLFIQIVYVKSQSNCTLNNLIECCSSEGGKQALTFIQSQPVGINTEQVVKYYTDLCKFRTLYEQASFIKAQYDKLSTADLTTMFTTPKPTQKSTITPRTTQEPTISTQKPTATRTTQEPTISSQKPTATRTTQEPTISSQKPTATKTTEKSTINILRSTEKYTAQIMNKTKAP